MDLDNLSVEEREELTVLYNKILNLYKEKADLEALKKDRENTLKQEIAEVCEIKNKSGEALAAKVKMPIVLAILDELYADKPNKKDQEADLLDIYRRAIKNTEVNPEIVEAFLTSNSLLKENQENIKEAYKETSVLSKELLDAVNLLAKEQFKNFKEDALNKAGFETKAPKDKSEIYELKTQLEAFFTK